MCFLSFINALLTFCTRRLSRAFRRATTWGGLSLWGICLYLERPAACCSWPPSKSDFSKSEESLLPCALSSSSSSSSSSSENFSSLMDKDSSRTSKKFSSPDVSISTSFLCLYPLAPLSVLLLPVNGANKLPFFKFGKLMALGEAGLGKGDRGDDMNMYCPQNRKSTQWFCW